MGRWINAAGCVVGIGALCTAARAGSDEAGSTNAARAYEAELMADAGLRTSNLAAAGAGWEKGKFWLGDGDANRLEIGGFNQTRYQMNFRRSTSPSENNFTHGFENRRTQLILAGTVFDPNLSFELQGEFVRATGIFTLLNVYGRYKWDNGFYARWGQFKTNLMREENVGDKGQLTTERSVVNAVFTQTRSQGVGLGWAGKEVRAALDFTDGLGTLNTEFDDQREADYALTGRVDWMFIGEDMKVFDQFSSWRGTKTSGMWGVAAHYQAGGDTGGRNVSTGAVTGTLDRDFFQATTDVTIAGDGWSAFAAFVWRDTDAAGMPRFDDFGALAQAGYFVTDQAELFARYDVVFPDNGRTGGHDPFNTVTAGVNYYVSPHSQAFRITGDVIYFLDDQAGSASIVSPSGSQDLLASPKSQWGVRLQIQVAF